MKSTQQQALEVHLEELSETLEYEVDPFFTRKSITFELKQIIDAGMTNKAKLTVLLKLIKAKDNGWDSIITYLRSNNYGNLAEKLETSAGESVPLKSKRSNAEQTPEFAIEFKKKLANFYMTECCHVLTVFTNQFKMFGFHCKLMIIQSFLNQELRKVDLIMLKC